MIVFLRPANTWASNGRFKGRDGCVFAMGGADVFATPSGNFHALSGAIHKRLNIRHGALDAAGYHPQS